MFSNYYKYTGFNEEALQENRRHTLLQEQKRYRALNYDEHRNNQILDVNWQEAPPRNADKKQCKLNCSLQLSEWFRESPSDLGQWYLVPCPKGQRCLVIAMRKLTYIYSKNGRLFHRFKSQLPGSDLSGKGVTILDCIYVQEKHIFYVLDALAYGNHDLKLCEAEFRFFWLRCRFAENNFSVHNSHNEESFQLLDHFDLADMNSLTALLRYPFWPNNNPKLDGFLFYHKESSYICGSTPLVCWLFPFMIPDVLGLKVSAEYSPPEDYCNPQQYIEKFNAKQKSSRRSRYSNKHLEKSVESMEIECENSTEILINEFEDNSDINIP